MIKGYLKTVIYTLKKPEKMSHKFSEKKIIHDKLIP